MPYFLHLGAGPWEEINDPPEDPGFYSVGPGAQQETQRLPFPLRSGSGGVGWGPKRPHLNAEVSSEAPAALGLGRYGSLPAHR